MKKIICILGVSVLLASCEHSEGSKFGLLQKVSHKTSPCDYYEIQIAYEGGVSTSSDKGNSYSNAQDFKIDKVAFDTLSAHIGEKIIFDYNDKGFAACGGSRYISSIRVK